MPVGFQPYKSILQPALHIPTSRISFLCWGRGLESITSCSLLSDSSSIDDIPRAVPTTAHSHTCCWDSSVEFSYLFTLIWDTPVGKCFIKLALMDTDLWLLHIIRVVQRNWCANAENLGWCLHAVWMYCCKLWGIWEKTFFADLLNT